MQGYFLYTHEIFLISAIILRGLKLNQILNVPGCKVITWTTSGSQPVRHNPREQLLCELGNDAENEYIKNKHIPVEIVLQKCACNNSSLKN